MKKTSQFSSSIKKIIIALLVCLVIVFAAGLTYRLIVKNDSGSGTDIGGGETPGGEQGGNTTDPETPFPVGISVVTFDPNGGTLWGDTQFSTQENGKLSEFPTDPIRDGFNFLGWFSAPSDGFKIIPSSVFIADTTVYAQWSNMNLYQIRFDANGGEMNPNDELYYITGGDGKLLAFPHDPTRTDHEFVGWFTARDDGAFVSDEYVFAEDSTVYAHWSVLSIYTITFDPNGGELTDGNAVIKTQKTGSLGTLPADPVREGYKFLGWYTAVKDGERIDQEYVFGQDTTAYARWKSENIHTVTFDPGIAPITYFEKLDTDESGKLSGFPESPVWEGCEFLGWFSESENGEKIDIDNVYSDNTTVFAQWSRVSVFRVRFAYSQSSWKKATRATVDFDDYYTGADGRLKELPPNPIREGYEFLYWRVTIDGERVPVTTDLVFPVDKIAIPYGVQVGLFKVNFDPGLGTIPGYAEFESVQLTTPDDSNLLTELPADPVLEGREFLGWYTERSGGEKVDLNYEFTAASTTVYAHWNSENTYVVSFDVNGGSEVYNTRLETGENKQLSNLPADPARAGYGFLGWFTERTGGERITTDYVFPSDMVVFAQWERTTVYLVRIAHGSGGNFKENSSTSYLDYYTEPDSRLKEFPEVIAKPGFVFDYWKLSGSDSENPVHVTTDYVFTKDSIVLGKWIQVGSFYVLFYPNGGAFPEDEIHNASVDYVRLQTPADSGQLTVFPTDPVREGYEFIGYYTAAEGGERVSLSTVFTENNTSIYAHWNEIRFYSITFDGNGGTLTDSSERVTGSTGTLGNMPSNPIRSGYNFAGWYTQPSGGTPINGAYEFKTNTTVYAQWRAEGEYAVTFDANGGTIVSGDTQYVTFLNGTLSELPTAFLDTKNAFSGWYTAQEGGRGVSQYYIFDCDCTLYAHYGESTTYAPGHLNNGTFTVLGEDDYNPLDDFTSADLAYTCAKTYKVSNGAENPESSDKKISFIFDSPYTTECFSVKYSRTTPSYSDAENEYIDNNLRSGTYHSLASFTIDNLSYPFDVYELSMGFADGKHTVAEGYDYRLSYSILPYSSVGIPREGAFVSGRILGKLGDGSNISACNSHFNMQTINIRVRTPYILCDWGGFYAGHGYSLYPENPSVHGMFYGEQRDGTLIDLNNDYSDSFWKLVRFGIDRDGNLYISSLNYQKLNFVRFEPEDGIKNGKIKFTSYGRYSIDFGYSQSISFVKPELRNILQSQDLYVYFSKNNPATLFPIGFYNSDLFLGNSAKLQYFIFKISNEFMGES